jgi:hypothetical protein
MSNTNVSMDDGSSFDSDMSIDLLEPTFSSSGVNLSPRRGTSPSSPDSSDPQRHCEHVLRTCYCNYCRGLERHAHALVERHLYILYGPMSNSLGNNPPSSNTTPTSGASPQDFNVGGFGMPLEQVITLYISFF